MFEFLQTTEKKNAFKKALNEITHEKPEPIVFSEKKSVAGAPRHYSTAIINPLRKPETTAVDLKNFKDWRHVDKVKSDNPIYKKPTPVVKNDDEEKTLENLPQRRNLEKTNPLTSTEVIDRFAAIPKDEPQKDKNVMTYLDKMIERREANKKVTLQELVNRFQADKNEPTKKTDTDVKIIINNNSKAETKPAAPVVKEEPVDKKIRVEVVDFTDKKSKPKSSSKRKPRGKGKKRFDADVISSVDWK